MTRSSLAIDQRLELRTESGPFLFAQDLRFAFDAVPRNFPAVARQLEPRPDAQHRSRVRGLACQVLRGGERSDELSSAWPFPKTHTNLVTRDVINSADVKRNIDRGVCQCLVRRARRLES
ncbi:MAG: hypothetical protein HYV07_10040 [Deltaproteobacteria bacterium]|nr:hypothetical protein [Deltaproteobacteria bacterium]